MVEAPAVRVRMQMLVSDMLAVISFLLQIASDCLAVKVSPYHGNTDSDV